MGGYMGACKSMESPSPMSGVGSGQMTKNFINLDIIKIIQFCLKIYDLKRHLHPWVGVCIIGSMDGSVGQWVGSDHITKYQINLELIKIIQFMIY